MWPAKSDAGRVLWLYIGAQCLQWQVRVGARWADDSFHTAPLAWGDEEGLCRVLRGCAQSPAWLRATHQARHLQVVISDHWLASASVPWSPAQLNRTQALQDAHEHLAGAGHEPGAHDNIRLDDCSARQPRLAVAYRPGVVDALRDLAQEAGADTVRIDSLGIVVTARLASARTPQVPESLAIVEPGGLEFRSAVLVKLESRCSRVERLVTRNFLEDEEQPWQGLAQVLARLSWAEADKRKLCAVLDGDRAGQFLQDAARLEQLPWVPVDWHVSGEPLAPGGSDWLQWLGSAGKPASGSLAISLARARSGTLGFRRASPINTHLGLWHVGAIASVIGATVWFGAHAIRHHNSLSEARQANASLVLRDRAVKPLTALTTGRLLAVNRAIAHLNIPLEGVLTAIQPPKDIQIGLLGLEASAANLSRTGAAAMQPALKIVAEAPTARDMTQYVAYLSGRGPLTHAELLGHELGTSPHSVPLYRFSVEIGWRP